MIEKKLTSRILVFFVIFLIFTALPLGCKAPFKSLKSSLSGTVYRDGRPASGNVGLFDPKTLSPIANTVVMQGGKFMLKDLPKGEWLIGLTSRTGGVIGKYHYIKIISVGYKSDFVFDVMEEDPKAIDLISRTGGGTSSQ